ncbi:MAG TPA: hypothetical protein VGM57_08150 [Pseudolabrys sp.]|jgi:hypothetical protein
MTRTLFIFLLGLLASFAALTPRAATAGDYSYGGYYDRSYNSNCCYRRVVRYERIYRDYDRQSYRQSYDDSPYYSSSRSYSYPASRYSGYDYSARYSYDQPRRLYAADCYSRRYRVYDGRGGWVWGSRSVCD